MHVDDLDISPSKIADTAQRIVDRATEEARRREHALERRFAPELRNRFDEVVLFSPLTHDEVRQVARHYIAQVTHTLAHAGKTLAVSPEALERLVEQGYSMAFGARFLKRVIDERIKLPISERWREASHFDVVVREGAVVVEPSRENGMSAGPALAMGDVA